MYNPIELSRKIEQIVIKGNLKKYYRFRPTGFYGGISTADTVGCNLRCKFCWSSNSVWNANKTGNFYSPEIIADKLLKIAKMKNYSQIRISGGEPTIGKRHLINILENINSSYVFILETNGILLGAEPDYIKDLSSFKNLHIRVCLKGSNPKEFSLLTGAKKGFEYQLKCLEHLKDNSISFNIAIVSSNKYEKQKLYENFNLMGLGNIMIEEEEIKLYPLVKKRLIREGLIDYFL